MFRKPALVQKHAQEIDRHPICYLTEGPPLPPVNASPLLARSLGQQVAERKHAPNKYWPTKVSMTGRIVHTVMSIDECSVTFEGMDDCKKLWLVFDQGMQYSVFGPLRFTVEPKKSEITSNVIIQDYSDDENRNLSMFLGRDSWFRIVPIRINCSEIESITVSFSFTLKAILRTLQPSMTAGLWFEMPMFSDTSHDAKIAIVIQQPVAYKLMSIVNNSDDEDTPAVTWPVIKLKTGKPEQHLAQPHVWSCQAKWGIKPTMSIAILGILPRGSGLIPYFPSFMLTSNKYGIVPIIRKPEEGDIRDPNIDIYIDLSSNMEPDDLDPIETAKQVIRRIARKIGRVGYFRVHGFRKGNTDIKVIDINGEITDDVIKRMDTDLYRLEFNGNGSSCVKDVMEKITQEELWKESTVIVISTFPRENSWFNSRTSEESTDSTSSESIEQDSTNDNILLVKVASHGETCVDQYKEYGKIYYIPRGEYLTSALWQKIAEKTATCDRLILMDADMHGFEHLPTSTVFRRGDLSHISVTEKTHNVSEMKIQWQIGEDVKQIPQIVYRMDTEKLRDDDLKKFFTSSNDYFPYDKIMERDRLDEVEKSYAECQELKTLDNNIRPLICNANLLTRLARFKVEVIDMNTFSLIPDHIDPLALYHYDYSNEKLMKANVARGLWNMRKPLEEKGKKDDEVNWWVSFEVVMNKAKGLFTEEELKRFNEEFENNKESESIIATCVAVSALKIVDMPLVSIRTAIERGKRYLARAVEAGNTKISLVRQLLEARD